MPSRRKSQTPEERKADIEIGRRLIVPPENYQRLMETAPRISADAAPPDPPGIPAPPAVGGYGAPPAPAPAPWSTWNPDRLSM